MTEADLIKRLKDIKQKEGFRSVVFPLCTKNTYDENMIIKHYNPVYDTLRSSLSNLRYQDKTLLDASDFINQSIIKINEALENNLGINAVTSKICLGYSLKVSQIPTLCGGGVLENINNMSDGKSSFDELKEALDFIVHCRSMYYIKHKYCYTEKSSNKVDTTKYPNYFSDMYGEMTYQELNNKLNYLSAQASVRFIDDTYGFTYLTCNLNRGRDGTSRSNTHKALLDLGFVNHLTTTNLKTGNQIAHYSINLEEYVKTQQSTITSKKTKEKLQKA